jgi:alpha-L-fucosidase
MSTWKSIRNWTRRDVFRVSGASVLGGLGGDVCQANTNTFGKGIVIQAGPFSASDQSFKHYSCPEWFRDAKFGIWAHWGPTSAIGDGDWHARNMYIEGNTQ